MTLDQQISSVAFEVVRRRMRDAVLSSVRGHCDLPLSEQMSAIEDEVMAAISDRDIAWALAYVAGVRMAPELIARAIVRPAPLSRTPLSDFPGAQAPPPNPPQTGGG